MDTIMTLEELAKMTPISVPVLRREIKAGKLLAHKIGGRIFVFAADWEHYLDETVITGGVKGVSEARQN